MFGGDVEYLCLAIDLAFAKDVCLPEKIRRALPKVKVYQNPSRWSWIEHSLPDLPALFARPAFHRGDVFHMMSKTAGSRSRHRRRPGEGEKA